MGELFPSAAVPSSFKEGLPEVHSISREAPPTPPSRMDGLRRSVHAWFSDTKDRRTPAALERERWVLGAPWSGAFSVRGWQGLWFTRPRTHAECSACAWGYTPCTPPCAPQRWMIVLPVLFVQMSIGSLYSWSIFNAPLDKVGATAWSKNSAASMQRSAPPLRVPSATRTPPL